MHQRLRIIFYFFLFFSVFTSYTQQQISPQQFYQSLSKQLPLLDPDQETINLFLAELNTVLNNKTATTQTYSHLATVGLTKPIEFFQNNIYQPQLIQAAVKEIELCNNGYYVFYHAQESFFGFYQTISTQLIQKLYQEGLCTINLPDHFFFIWLPKHLHTLINNPLEDILQKAAQRKRMAIMHNQIGHYHDCLSVNAFLFGNSDKLPCCTWNFIVNNTNRHGYNGPDLGNQLFEKLGYPLLFNQYKTELTHLRRLYCQFFTTGQLLQIAIPEQLVDQCAFISRRGARRTCIQPNDNHKIYRVTEQMNYCKNLVKRGYGYDSELHHCLIMTEDILLNPLSGIKIFTYNQTPNQRDSITYQEYCKQVDQLINKIANAIKNS